MASIIRSDPKAREKPCLRCGSSLRQHLDARYCPGCGLSVWLSLNQNDALDWSKPDWLRMMSLASLVLAVAQAPAALAWGLLRARGPVGWVALLAAAVYFVLLAAGLALLSWPEHRHPDRFRGQRLALRIAAGASLLLGVLMLWGAGRRDGGQEVAAGTITCVELAGLVCSIVAFAYLRPLARRIPNSAVARICGYLLFLPILGLLAVIPFVAGTFLFMFFHYIMLYLPWVYLPIAGVVLIGFSLTFLRASRSAAAHWAAESTPMGSGT